MTGCLSVCLFDCPQIKCAKTSYKKKQEEKERGNEEKKERERKRE